MVKSGLEAGINMNKSKKRCPKCNTYRTKIIKSKYTELYLCNNENCNQLVFS